MTNTLRTLCQNRRQRRRSLQQAQAVLTGADDLLFWGLLFVVFLFPLLLDPTLLFNLSAWLWWVKGYAWVGLLAWAVVRFLVGAAMAPAQITGATVEAMELATADERLVPFPAAPAERECSLLPWRHMTQPVELKTSIRVRCYRQRLWRRSRRRLLFYTPTRHIRPPALSTPEPSA